AEAADAPRFLDRLRAGEASAFEELVTTYQHRVFGVALRMLGNAAEAQDVAQEALPPRSPGARRLSGRREAVDLALRHHLAALPQSPRFRRATARATGRGDAPPARRRPPAAGRRARAQRAGIGAGESDRRICRRSGAS